MELRQLTYFACLYRERSVTRASQRLNIVQPALSAQIAKLEGELGQVLFERTSKGMIPTTAGDQAYELFVPILDRIAHARSTLSERSRDISGAIRIGLVASATNAALADTIAYFTEHYPQLSIYVTPGFTTELVDKLGRDELDCIVINQAHGQEEYAAREILDEELVLVSGGQARVLAENPVPLHMLTSLDLVLPSRRHGLRRAIEDVLESRSIEVWPRVEIDDATVIEEFIRRTDCYSLLPSSMVNRALESGTLRAYALGSPGITRRMICLRNPDRSTSPAESVFIDVLADRLTELQRATSAYTRRTEQ